VSLAKLNNTKSSNASGNNLVITTLANPNTLALRTLKVASATDTKNWAAIPASLNSSFTACFLLL